LGLLVLFASARAQWVQVCVGVVCVGNIWCCSLCEGRGAVGIGMISSFTAICLFFLDGSTEKSKDLMIDRFLLVYL
jgi:hypothetical protein